MAEVKNTAPIIHPETGQQLTCRFLGNINPKTVLEKNELRAYLKGQTRFGYKTKDIAGNTIYPYKVRQEYFYQ